MPLLPAAPSAPPGQPVRWRDLSADSAATYWPLLDSWVRWWIEREHVPISTVPPCWYLHGELIEELTALERGYELLYHPTSPGNGALAFRREVEAGRLRLAAFTKASGCTPKEHKSQDEILWLGDVAHEVSFREHVEFDVSERERTAGEGEFDLDMSGLGASVSVLP